jgi:hypothetical protein
MENEVVAHPQRVEPVALGEPRAFDQQVLIRLEAEVRHEESETRSHHHSF